MIGAKIIIHTPVCLKEVRVVVVFLDAFPGDLDRLGRDVFLQRHVEPQCQPFCEPVTMLPCQSRPQPAGASWVTGTRTSRLFLMPT